MENVAERLVLTFIANVGLVEVLSDVEESDPYSTYYQSAKWSEMLESGEGLQAKIERLYDQKVIDAQEREDAVFQLSLQIDRLREYCKSSESTDFCLASIEEEMIDEYE